MKDQIRQVPDREGLTMKEVCLVAGISLSSLYKRFAEGDGPPTYRVGVKSRRARKEAVLEWMRQMEARETAEENRAA